MILIAGTSTTLQRLDDRCYEYMRKGFRPSTHKNKRSQAAIYTHFCKVHELDEFPADEWQLIRYATYTAERVTTAGTVNNYVASVRSLQELAGFPAPAPSSPNLKLVMNGIKNYLAKPVNQAVPMTIEILEQIADIVNYDNEFEFCAFAAMLTGFYLLLRSSSLVPVSSNKFDPHE